MTTQEHLNKIKAKCEQLLELAAKRSAEYVAPEAMNRRDWDNDRSRKTGGGGCLEINSLQFHGMKCDDAFFIASCAGPAEAGWKATIALVDWFNQLQELKFPATAEQKLISTILSAWPEELL